MVIEVVLSAVEEVGQLAAVEFFFDRQEIEDRESGLLADRFQSLDFDEPGLSVIEQSLAFAEASEGNAFIFTKSGLTTGVGCESGAIPEYLVLRSPERRRCSPETFCIFEDAEYDPDTETYEPKFGSASIDEMDKTYDIPFRYFADREDLVDSLTSFVESYVVPSTFE